MTKRTIPAVSIIIPMYNTEKYIGECLDSILAQTFEDYEVIVVDDCSTDNSASIVESYIPKFGDDKLQLVRSEINFGGAGTPRNIGMKTASGKYLMFVDSDDAISKTALEELYGVARKFQADVVACEKWYQTPMNGDIFDRNSLKIIGPPTIKRVNKPVVVDSNMTKRVNELSQLQFVWSSCMKLIRRDMILANNLEIMDISGEDTVFTCCMICSETKYVRVPNIIYTYRTHDASVTHRAETAQSLIHKWGMALTVGFNYLNGFLSKRTFFQQHPELRHIALEVVVREFSSHLIKVYSRFPAYQLDPFVRAEFENCDNLPTLAAFLFGRMSAFNVNIIRLQQQLQNLKKS